VVTGDSIVNALTSIITRELNVAAPRLPSDQPAA
jgi:hypothetical protein